MRRTAAGRRVDFLNSPAAQSIKRFAATGLGRGCLLGGMSPESILSIIAVQISRPSDPSDWMKIVEALEGLVNLVGFDEGAVDRGFYDCGRDRIDANALFR